MWWFQDREEAGEIVKVWEEDDEQEEKEEKEGEKGDGKKDGEEEEGKEGEEEGAEKGEEGGGKEEAKSAKEEGEGASKEGGGATQGNTDAPTSTAKHVVVHTMTEWAEGEKDKQRLLKLYGSFFEKEMEIVRHLNAKCYSTLPERLRWRALDWLCSSVCEVESGRVRAEVEARLTSSKLIDKLTSGKESKAVKELSEVPLTYPGPQTLPEAPRHWTLGLQNPSPHALDPRP